MTQGFYELNPNNVLSAVEKVGFIPTGEMTQLNSYENRVFDIRVEPNKKNVERVVAKFYRPGRWTEAAINDEHEFLMDLQKESIPAVGPIVLNTKKTIMKIDNIFVSLFPKIKARMPQEFIGDQLKQVGLLLARLHNVGAQKKASHRKQLTTEFFGWESLTILEKWVAPEIWSRYEKAAIEILECLDDRLQPSEFIRIHGDCHKGNLLHTGQEFFFVDFDDFCNGPVAQDFWMLFSGDQTEEEIEMILSGYTQIRDFDETQTKLFEPLRGLRILYYARWIATRWDDPTFPHLFPDFKSYTYWAEEVEALERVAWSL